eukprot:Gregarina_sp_Poly_1__4274@NODE_2326_length_2291_cov_60_365558_g1489_i0_p1_GENE_NODE_2326_length_2291_cov_60_365558_g1489_i0NODE_2326_length_2291_cov_60_365558_g1489_i0_p1_ORF_typecomplete_len412_score43_95Glycos_transf_4/PF00953_21/32Glycos_transf_4/PF00953_21/9_2e43Mtp/PF03821_16/1_8e02Mtp/PF03821_16/22WTF/PF03303_13/7_3e02WTF/PF03303_13/0_41_NODE_2326_length_2291_cov_60_365558_g1489_i09982233
MSHLQAAIDGLAHFGFTTSFSAILAGLLWDTSSRTTVLVATAVGVVCYWAVYKLVPNFALRLKEKGLSGTDLNKQSDAITNGVRTADPTSALRAKVTLPQVPEALGVVPGFLYLVGGVVCYLGVSHNEYSSLQYISGLLCVIFVTFLGFVDDVLDLRWRYKVILPLFASIPLIVVYQGPTSIIFPSFLKPIIPFKFDQVIIFELGALYKIYMASLIVFCSNAINIYAGLNGLEVGQSIVIAIFIIIHNSVEILSSADNSSTAIHHGLSLTLSIIFLFSVTALFVYNKYPSKIFVGDTFTYFAGVHFAVVGIVGHFAKTLLLFFLPQILNFLLSCPQLFGFIPCPRHRVPILDVQTGKLLPSQNLTVINLTLHLFGPMTERNLVNLLLVFQTLCGFGALLIRYSPLYNVLFL